jgi:hypothetical protein
MCGPFGLRSGGRLEVQAEQPEERHGELMTVKTF